MFTKNIANVENYTLIYLWKGLWVFKLKGLWVFKL